MPIEAGADMDFRLARQLFPGVLERMKMCLAASRFFAEMPQWDSLKPKREEQFI